MPHPGDRPTAVRSGDVPYDTDLGPVEVVDFPDNDRKRWAKAENWGAWLAYPEDGADQYHEVWMLRWQNGRVRFVARGGQQYGPEHSSLVAATYWAFGHGWRDPEISDEHNLHCIVEVRTALTELRGQA
jgi:hypothetical protein